VILVVEDSPEDEALIRRALDECGEVIVVRDGKAALEVLLAGDRPLPEVVLLDMNLPGIKGPEVLKKMRASPRARHVPVVILTSSAKTTDVARTYELGANSFVIKPRDAGRFTETIRALARYWIELNRVPA
jgi:two-component system response regulator